MIRFILPVIVFAVLVVMFTIGLNRDPTILPSPYIGKSAPAFELVQLQDPRRTLSNLDYAGQVVLINVWATWCVGCRQEHDFLMQLAENDIIPIYGLNWRDQRDEALRWIRQLGNPYVASGFDADGRVGIDWGVYGAPETFLIGKDGTVLFKYLGPLNAEVWEMEFEPRIREARGVSM